MLEMQGSWGESAKRFIWKTAPNLTSQVYRNQEGTWTLIGKLQLAVEAFPCKDIWITFLVVKESIEAQEDVIESRQR